MEDLNIIKPQIEIKSQDGEIKKERPFKLKKCKAVRFRRSFKHLEDTKFLSVFFQRVFILTWICKRFSNCMEYLFPKDVTKSDEDDEDIIIIKKQPELTPDMIRNQDNEEKEIDIESGAQLGDLDDVERNDISDTDFSEICQQSSVISRRYARTFKFFDIMGKFADVMSIAFLPLGQGFLIPNEVIITILSFCVPLILLQFACDFGKLEDKYSVLYSRFAKLSKSKDVDRVEKYNKLVVSFRNNWVFSDFIRNVDVDYETQYDV